MYFESVSLPDCHIPHHHYHHICVLFLLTSAGIRKPQQNGGFSLLKQLQGKQSLKSGPFLFPFCTQQNNSRTSVTQQTLKITLEVRHLKDSRKS